MKPHIGLSHFRSPIHHTYFQEKMFQSNPKKSWEDTVVRKFKLRLIMALFPLRYFINIRVRSRFEIQFGHSRKKMKKKYTIEIHLNFFSLLLITNLKFKYWTNSNQYGLTVEEFTISCLDFLAGGGVVLPWCSDKTNSSSKIQVNNFQKVFFFVYILFFLRSTYLHHHLTQKMTSWFVGNSTLYFFVRGILNQHLRFDVYYIRSNLVEISSSFAAFLEYLNYTRNHVNKSNKI